MRSWLHDDPGDQPGDTGIMVWLAVVSILILIVVAAQLARWFW